MKTCSKCRNTFEDTVGFCPHDGEVLQESPPDMVGQVLDGQYEVEAFIAQGGMGAVYRARHILLGDRVVIKTLRSEMRHNSEWLRRFQREGQAARRFRHPNAVTVYDLRTAPDGTIYMVMEYVEGRTLDKELKARGRVSASEALALLAPVAEVLDAAHATGVVHRDLKPENVMVGAATDGARPVVKLLDLGIAKMLGIGDAHAGEASSLTVAGQLLGTPYYMSPEQWGELPRDGGAEVDGRTDIYSLGLMFYEIIAGRKPFTAKSLADLRHKHVSAPVEPLHTLAPDITEAFSRAVARALAKDRGDRQATAGELIAELRSALGAATTPQAAFDATIVYDTGDARDASAVESPGSTAFGGTPLAMTENTLVTDVDEAVTLPPHGGAVHPQAGTNTHATSVDTTANHNATDERVAGASFPPARSRHIEETMATLDAAASSGVAGGARRATPTQHGVGASAQDSDAARGPVSAEPARRAAGPLAIGGVLLVLLLAAAGLGVWFVWKRAGAAKTAGDASRTTTGAAEDAPATADERAVAGNVEALRYWVMAYPKEGEGVRLATEPLTLLSDQQFQLHFVPNETGYLYLVAQEDDGPMMTLLTSKPAQVKSNQINSGAELVYPPGENVLELDKNTGTETIIGIFSTEPLTRPAALTMEVGRKLTPAEQSELSELINDQGARASEPTVRDAGGASPHMSVLRAAENGAPGGPLVFKIRIEHR